MQIENLEKRSAGGSPASRWSSSFSLFSGGQSRIAGLNSNAGEPPALLQISPLQFLQPARDFLGVGAAVEGADAEIAFAFRAKTAAGRDDHVRLT
jgi:hypothetical protein